MLPLIAPLLLQVAAAATITPKRQSNSNGCDTLSENVPNTIFYRGDDVYEYEAAQFWSLNEIMDPECVFRPTSADEVAQAVQIMQDTETQFAVRGGGHMAIKGSNNIDDGPLFVMSNLTALEVNEDENYVWVGPGHDWGQVFSYLSKFNLAAAGGRLSPVGVPGLLLAGGVNFHGNQHGWAADNVIEYEIVLANGTVKYATACSDADLFWALKGGSSNFGIVTKFKLNTFPSSQVLAGVYSVTDIPAFLEATANFSQHNTDPLAHVVPQVIQQGNMTIGGVILFYDSPDVEKPDCFAPFFDIEPVSSTVGFKTLAEFAEETGQLVVPEINDMFIAGTHVGKTYEDILKGVQIVNDLFLEAVPALQAIVPEEDLILVCVDWQPIGDLWLKGSQKSNPGGNALGFDPENKGTYMAWAEVVEWNGTQYDEQVHAWVKNTTWTIANATQEAGIWDPFLYMGDSTYFQTEIYEGYGEENHQRLLDISRKVDPDRVFQKLLPGGYKIGN